jgi:hypothetical protein
VDIRIVSPLEVEVSMTKLVLDTGFLSKLAGIRQTALLCDQSGRVIGYFEPLEPPTGKGEDGTESPFSDEEIERFRKQRSGLPLQDILAALESSE